MIVRCEKCKHIHDDGEQHTCPTPEYIALRDMLIAEVADVVPEEDEPFIVVGD